jgi:hypothetical protein
MGSSHRIEVSAGAVFGRWTIVQETDPVGEGAKIRRRMLCRCICGTEKVVELLSLRSGKSQGCWDCRHYRRGKNPKKTMKDRTYRIYWGMRERCYHQKCPAYPNYGGRGVTVCDRWLENYDNFVADMGEAPAGLSIDRIDNDGPYYPENCRWADRTTQANNTRSNLILEFNGQKMTLAEIAREAGVNYQGLHDRITYRGASLHGAISSLRNRNS